MRSRQRIVDATVRVLDRSGFPGVTIAAVAAEAGVSRQTVYSIFGGQPELMSQAVLSLFDGLLRDVRACTEGATTPGQWLAEAAVCARHHARGHPMLARLLAGGEANPLFGEDGLERALPVLGTLVAPLVERDPRLGPVLPDVLELMVRTALSLLMFDSPRVHDDDDLRHFLQGWVDPAVEGIMTRGGT